MKPLPPALLSPPGGQYPFREAIKVWLHLYYGFVYDADENSLAYQRARDKAYGDLRPLAKLITWRQNPTIWFHSHVRLEDLARLASDRGISFPTLNQSTKPPPPTIIVDEQPQLGTHPGQTRAPQTTTGEKTRGIGGRPADPNLARGAALAIEYIQSGKSKTDAAYVACVELEAEGIFVKEKDIARKVRRMLNSS